MGPGYARRLCILFLLATACFVLLHPAASCAVQPGSCSGLQPIPAHSKLPTRSHTLQGGVPTAWTRGAGKWSCQCLTSLGVVITVRLRSSGISQPLGGF